MPPYLALALCFCLILALFVLDRQWRRAISIGGSIPIIWALVQGSRPITTWFSPSSINSLEAVYEGSPVDRAVYLVLIAAGLWILLARRFDWLRYASTNKWIVVFFGYLCLSLLWSDYTFIAFKRWVKDLGNLIMILVVMSEADPISAGKALFIRASYVLVPLSVVAMKYFPEVSRYFDPWGRGYSSAIAADKNMLGMTLTVLALALMWGLIEAGREKPNGGRKLEVAAYAMLLGMIVWLLRAADCATALACSSVGAAILVILSMTSVRRTLAIWVTLGIAVLSLAMVPDVRMTVLEPIVGLLGREINFTGRDAVWRAVLAEDINPIIGTGAYSFWMGERIEVGIAGLKGTNEAHNAYLEVYLNVGLVGLALYLVMLAGSTRRAVRQLVRGETEGDRFRFAFLIITVMYGVTEAVVRQNLIWLGLLLVASRSLPGMQSVLAGQVPSPVRAKYPLLIRCRAEHRTRSGPSGRS